MFALPKKCTPSVTRISLLLHLLGSVWYFFAVYYDRMYHDLPSHNRYGGRFQFLSFLTLYFTLGASIFAALVDAIQLTTNLLHSTKPTKDGYLPSSSMLIWIRDELMSFWVYTLCAFVSLLFWGIAAFDLEGVHPSNREEITPLFGWFNHTLHTIPLIYAVVLVTYVNYEYCPMVRTLFNSVVFVLSYVGWIAYCAKINGIWAYGILQNQNTIEFTIFISLCIFIFVAVYLVGQKIASSVWTERLRKRILRKIERKQR